MASLIPNRAKKAILNNEFDWANNTYKLSLHTSSFSPTVDGTSFFSDCTNEISGTGYTAGGYTLTNLAVTQDDTNDLAYLDADDVTDTGVTFTCRFAVVYESTGTASTSKVVAVIDYGADKSPYNGTFTNTWATTGVIKLS